MFNSNNFKNTSNGLGPTLIILRGPASSGKSTISKDLMKLLNEKSDENIYNNPFFLFPYEDLLLFNMMDSDFLVNGKKTHRGFKIQRNSHGDIIDFTCSDWASRLYETYKNTINNYLEGNFNIICEGNFINIESIKDLIKRVKEINKDYKIKIFSLNVPLEILEKREKARKDRDKGFAKLQFFSYEETLKKEDYQYIIPINENYSVKEITNRILNIYNNSNGFSPEEILNII
jgi:tRNA uridine 5-carbamoylmethylation protein Kti12